MPVAGGGMFGVTPQEVYQQQQQGINQSARDIAGMDGFTAAKYAMGQVGGGLARPVAGMLGLKNTQMDEAQQAQDIQSQIDHSTPEGLMKGAQLFNQAGNPRMAMMYQQAAQSLQAQLDAAELNQVKQDYYTTKANAPAAAGRPVLSVDDNGVTTAVWPDGTTKELGRIGKTKSQGSVAADKGAWVDTEQAGLKGQKNTVTGEFKPYKGQTAGGTRSEQARLDKLRQNKKKDTDMLAAADSQLKDVTSKAAELTNHPGLDRITGWNSVGGENLDSPNSPASAARALLTEFKSATQKAGLQLVRQGGGIGSMTEKEWKIIEGMIANLDPKPGKAFLQGQIQKVVNAMADLRSNVQRSYDDTYYEVANEPSNIAPATGKPVVPATLAAPVQNQSEEWVRDASGKLVRK